MSSGEVAGSFVGENVNAGAPAGGGRASGCGSGKAGAAARAAAALRAAFGRVYAPEGMSPFIYSASYNGAYLGAEAAITLILLAVPAVRKALAQVKTQALG